MFSWVFSTSTVRPRPPIRFVWILMALQQASLEASCETKKRWFVQDCSSSQCYRHYSSPHIWLDWADCIPCSSNSALSENTWCQKFQKFQKVVSCSFQFLKFLMFLLLLPGCWSRSSKNRQCCWSSCYPDMYLGKILPKNSCYSEKIGRV